MGAGGVKLGPYLLGPNDTPENGIYTGDAMELAKAIPDESVDLIFTDPVYWEIEHYRWLAEMAARVLKDDGQALIYQAHKWLPETMEALRPLRFVWTLGERMVGAQARYWPLKMFIGRRPLLWYCKDTVRPFSRMTSDFSGAISTTGDNFKWHKRIGRLFKWMRVLSEDGAVILDPFCGGGSLPAVCKQLGRHYLAFEIDPATAELARERVRNTQPPLFVADAQPEQSRMAGLDV